MIDTVYVLVALCLFVGVVVFLRRSKSEPAKEFHKIVSESPALAGLFLLGALILSFMWLVTLPLLAGILVFRYLALWINK